MSPKNIIVAPKPDDIEIGDEILVACAGTTLGVAGQSRLWARVVSTQKDLIGRKMYVCKNNLRHQGGTVPFDKVVKVAKQNPT